MEQAVDSFIRFLAVERGLSENYQLSTQRSLSEFAQWCAEKKKVKDPRDVTLALMSEYLADRKRAGLSASSIKLIVVALKIFFRFLAGKGAQIAPFVTLSREKAGDHGPWIGAHRHTFAYAARA